MEELLKKYDSFMAGIGGTSPILIMLYKLGATIFLTFMAWLIFQGVLSSIEKKVKTTRFSEVSDGLVGPAKTLIKYVLLVLSGTYVIRLLGVTGVENIYHALFLLLIASPLINISRVVLVVLEENIADRTETNLDNIIFDLLNRFVGVVIAVIAVIISLDTLGINVMPFIAGAGIVGVAIGFAAKDTLSNLIAGILLIIDRPFEVGDRIEVWSAPAGSASWGDVVEIGLRATKICTTDNIVIIIPNNEIMMRDIVNYTIRSSAIRVRVNIGVAYDADIARAKEIIAGVARTAEWVASEPAPKVVVRNFGESSVDLQLRVWIKDARKRMDTISYVTDNVKDAFDREGIEIPFPRRDLTIIHRQAAEQSAA